jgi:uncharacterized protein (DUF2126 family)
MWNEVHEMGRRVDDFLAQQGLAMTMGAEPTYLSARDSHLPEWTVEALGQDKQRLATRLAGRLQQRFASGGIYQVGQGKWYPGEDLPRWALRCVWPLKPRGPEVCTIAELLDHLCQRLGLDPGHARPCRNSSAWVLVMGFDEERGWQSCPWPQAEVSLLETSGPVGMRLPWSEVEMELGTALCVEPGPDGLQVFLPPVCCASAWLELVCALPGNAVLQGYAPPTSSLSDDGVPGLRLLSVTPDPGVVEVNLHPAVSWSELVDIVIGVDQDARACGLVSHRFGRDGTVLGSGGGCHVVVGGASPSQSPFALRPDFLRSILVWWNRHPSLSYLFSGLFVGPTCQAPRVDEARHEALYELELAFRELDCEKKLEPDMLGRIFRDLLVDVAGNGHRSEICVDKLFDPVAPGGQQGLLEFRALEMGPHPQHNLTMMLLLRALLGRLWKQPEQGPLRRFGTELHDRFMLPSFLWMDLEEVIDDLVEHGLSFRSEWYRPHFEFRFPLLGRCRCAGVLLELRTALEPWPVLGEGLNGQAASRPVDSSLQRVEVRLSGLDPDRHRAACNGHFLPIHPVGGGDFVAAVRFRAWQFSHSLHPTLGIQTPLQFDLVERGRSLGACRYHTMRPDGVPYEDFPLSAGEAEQRRASRFEAAIADPMAWDWSEPLPNPEFPMTLDLRLAALATAAVD